MKYCNHCGAAYTPELQVCTRCENPLDANTGQHDDRQSGRPCCPYCATLILREELQTACSECQRLHHQECWQENGGCTVYGCKNLPETEQYRDIEIPVSFWGQENKACPKCQEQVHACATRCRKCGATFSSVPVDRSQYLERENEQSKHPALKAKTILVFIFGIIPFTAPFALVLGSIWYRFNRKDLVNLPSLFSNLCKLGLVVALLELTLIAMATGWYSFVVGGGGS